MVPASETAGAEIATAQRAQPTGEERSGVHARKPASSLRGVSEILLSGFLPGALAGTQLAGLLFFLNPHLPFEPGPVARAVALYSRAARWPQPGVPPSLHMGTGVPSPGGSCPGA